MAPAETEPVQGVCPECGATDVIPHTAKCSRRPKPADTPATGPATGTPSGTQAPRVITQQDGKRLFIAGETAVSVDSETEIEDERLRVIASWQNPLDMINSEFPEQSTGESWKPWRIFLKVVHGLDLDPDELAFAQKCTGRTTMPRKPVRRVFCGPGRRGGKSFTSAIQAVYTAVRARTYNLAPGEVGTIPIVAADRRQARVIYNYVKGLLMASPRLRPMVVKANKDSIVLDNQMRIEIHTANYRTVRGYTVPGFFGDETAFWESSETSSNPDTEIINAVRPALMTTRGPLIITSTPYSRRGVLWQGYKDFWAKETDEGLYWKATSLDMNPGLDEDEIARAYEEDPEAAAAEYGGEFRSDLQAFISEDLINAVVIPGRGDLPYSDKYKYACFVDPSGGSEGGDSFTLAIGHTERNNIHVIDAIREVTPPYSTEGTVQNFTEVMALYKVKATTGDHYAGEWPSQMFYDRGGVQYHKSEFPKSDLYLQSLPLFTSGRIELPEHKRLIGQLRGLERRTARSGKDSIDHAPRGKDDVANAVCGVLALLARKRKHWGHIPAWSTTKSYTGHETTFNGGTPPPDPTTEPYYETRCPGCGAAMTGTADEIMTRIRWHWSNDEFRKHRRKGPLPDTIEEVLRRAA